MATRGSGSHSNRNLRPQGSQPQRENPVLYWEGG